MSGKDNSIIVKLVSTAGTGEYYTTRRPLRTKTGEPAEKLQLKKYDRKLRKMVIFKETKKLK